jgi:integrase
MDDKAKLTKSVIDKIPLTEAGQRFYWDSDLAGFGLRVGTGTKSYFAEGRVGGKSIRYTIGKHGVFTPEQARAEAREKLVLMAKGINPNEDKAQKKIKGVTLEQAFKEFLESRKNLKARTIYDYQRFMGMLPEKEGVEPKKSKTAWFADWRNRALVDITKEMVASRHRKAGQSSQAQANLAMRFLRAIFNFAAGKYSDSRGRPLITDNPVKGLSQTKAWYRVARRKTVIKPHELAPWYEAVIKIKNDPSGAKRETVRDYLLLLLFTGLRRQEAATLRRANVDLKAKTLTVLDTKNHEDHTLPLSDFLCSLMASRLAAINGDYVFPGTGKGGYLVEPRKQIERVIKASGIDFTLHDLRRTFSTIAESLDIPAYAIKRLLNHKMPSDVTAGYIVMDVERLREPMQKITDYILKSAGVKPTAQVAKIGRERKA